MWSISDWFPSWGDSGSQPASGFNYQGGEQVHKDEINYLWHALDNFEDESRAALSDIDTDADGIVDEADTTNLYKGVDIDNNGDGVVNQAASVNAVKGADLDTAYANVEDSATVEAADNHFLYVTEVADGDSLTVNQASLLSEDGTAAPSGTSIRFYNMDSGSDGGSILDGDGTLLVDESPNASYSNTSGTPTNIAVTIDNGLHGTGTGSQEHLMAAFTARGT